MAPREHWHTINIRTFRKMNLNNKNTEKITSYSVDACANVNIIGVNYAKQDVEKVAKEQKYLTLQRISQFQSIVLIIIKVFKENIDKWIGSPISVDLKAEETYFCAKPFRIMYSLKDATKKEINRLVE